MDFATGMPIEIKELRQDASGKLANLRKRQRNFPQDEEASRTKWSISRRNAFYRRDAGLFAQQVKATAATV